MSKEKDVKERNIYEDFNSPIMRILTLAIIGALAFGSFRLYKFIWPTPYVSQDYGFQVVFPQNPSVTTLPPQTDSGVKETGKIYSADNLTKGTDYAVEATDYSNTNFDSLSSSTKINLLESQVQSIATSDKVTITSGKPITFEGLTAVQATLSPSDHSEPDTNVVALLNKNRLYILLGAGMSASKFNSFTKTFKLVH